MPTAHNKSEQKKISKAYAICTRSQEKYGYGDKKKEECVRAVARRMGVKGKVSMKSEKKKMCDCKKTKTK